MAKPGKINIEVENLGGNFRPVAEILGKAVYALLKGQDSRKRAAKARQAMDEANEIIQRIDSA